MKTPTEQFQDRQQNAVSTAVRDARKASDANPWATSVVIGPYVFVGSDTRQLVHGLGRTPSRWVVEDSTGNPHTLRRVSWDDTYITLGADSPCTVVVRVAVD
jgi:hypothetical protein